MSDVTPLDTPNTPKTPHMIITNFNYEDSYLPHLICHIGVKAELGRSASRHMYTKLGRQTYFDQWTPLESRIDALNTTTLNLADEPHLANGPPMKQE